MVPLAFIYFVIASIILFVFANAIDQDSCFLRFETQRLSIKRIDEFRRRIGERSQQSLSDVRKRIRQPAMLEAKPLSRDGCVCARLPRFCPRARDGQLFHTRQ